MLQENWMHTIVEDGATQTSDSATYKKKLPTSNFIGNINLRCSMTVNNDGNDADFDHLFIDQIDKIKLIGNGSATILDLEPKELRKIMTPVLGAEPAYNRTSVEAATEWIDFPIVMGRYKYDEEYILPAQLFKTLELQVEYSVDVTDPAWDTGTFTIDVDVDELISAADPMSKKIIKRTQIENGATKSGTIDVDMPLGGIYKRIMVMVEDEDAADGTDVTKVQYRINNGSEIPLTANWDTLQNMNKDDFNLPDATVVGSTCKANDDTVLTELGLVKDFKVALLDPNPTANVVEICGADAISGGQLTMDMYKSAALTEATDANRTITAQTTCQTVMFRATSHTAIPEAVFIIFDKKGDMSKCPDSSRWNDAKVRLTGANANGTYNVCLEEIISV